MQKKIMYIEYKGDSIAGQGRIGLVEFSKTGKTIYYDGKSLQSLSANLTSGYKKLHEKLQYLWIKNTTWEQMKKKALPKQSFFDSKHVV